MWRLIDLGAIDGYTMTNLYEAIGHSVSLKNSPNTILLNHPKRPFVNIGYHQLMDKEINVDFAKQKGFDLVRRTLGGGAILDGPWEQDYFFIVRRGSIDCPSTIQEFYQKFMKPPLYVLNKLGLDATIRPPNDILVNGKKISGNGAISIEKANVLAGDLLLEAPTKLMSDIIKAPSEKFKDKLASSMREWITSIEECLGKKISRDLIKSHFLDGLKEELGVEFQKKPLLKSELEILNQLVEERKKDEWIFSKDKDLLMKAESARSTKIHGGVNVSEAVHKAGKMIRVLLVAEDKKIIHVTLSGDFFTHPYVGAVNKIESLLEGTPLIRNEISKKIEKGFKETGLVVYGASQEDFVDAILKADVSTG
jgi:lipoate-protein ligase A